MAISEDRLKQLEALQEYAIDHAVEEMDEARKLGLGDKDSRGDRAWLTKMCDKSLGVAVRVEQFIALHSRKGFEPSDPNAEEKAQAKFVNDAKAAISKILERAKQA